MVCLNVLYVEIKTEMYDKVLDYQRLKTPLSNIPDVDAYMKVYSSSALLVCYFIRCLLSVGRTSV